MACKPTFKGVEYNSINELKEAVYKSLNPNAEKIISPSPEEISKAKSKFESNPESNNFILMPDGKLIESGSNNETDGATFISLDRWKNIIKSQTDWTNDHQRLYEAVKNEQEIPSDLYYLAFEPLKMFHFENLIEESKENDSTALKNFPFQQKDAKFLLTKQMAGNSLELNKILNLFNLKTNDGKNKLKLDEVSFSSAVKVGGDRKLNLSELNESNSSLLASENMYVLDNTKTGIQVNTLGDHEEYRAAGSQFWKILPFGVVKDSDYNFNGKKIKGSELLSLLNESIIKSVNESFDELTKDFMYDESKNISEEEFVENKNKAVKNLIDKISRVAENLDYGEDFIDSIQQDFDGNPKTPLYNGSIVEKIERILFAEFKKKVLKIMSPGGSFINAPAIGRSDKLNYVYNEDGSLKHVEVAMSASSHEYLDYFANEEGVIDLNLLPEELLEAVAYRIPTEAKYSIFKIKVVEFLPHSSAGHQIIMPKEAPSISGFDFDIDKLFTIFSNYTVKLNRNAYPVILDSMKKEFPGIIFDNYRIELLMNNSIEKIELNENNLFTEENIDHKKYLNKLIIDIKNNEKKSGKASNLIRFKKIESNINTKEGRENIRLDIALSILSNINHAEEVTAPSSFEPIKKLAKKMLEKKNLSNEEIDFLSIKGRQSIVDSAMSGAKLKGIASLANTSHLIFSSQDPNIDKGITVNGLPIYRDIIVRNDGSKNIISNNLNMFLAAILDNQKYPLSKPLNINIATSNMFVGLLRIGVSMNDAVEIMNHPYVIELTKESLRKKESLEKTIRSKFKKDGDDSNSNYINELNEIISGVKTESQINSISGNLGFLNFVGEIGDIVSKLTSSINSATNGSKNFAVAEKNQVSFNSLLEIDGSDSMLLNGMEDFMKDKENPYHWMFVLNEYGLEKIPDAIAMITKAPFMQSGFASIKNILSDFKGYGLNEKEIKSINMHYLNAMMISTNIIGNKYERNNLISKLPSSIKVFIKNNPNTHLAKIMSNATIMNRDSTFKYDYIKVGSKLSNIDKAEIKRLWNNGLQENYNGDEFDVVTSEEVKLLTDLAIYTIISSGMSYNPISFSEMIPSKFYTTPQKFLNLNESINDALENQVNELRYLEISSNNKPKIFIEQYLRHVAGTEVSPLVDMKENKMISLIEEIVDPDDNTKLIKTKIGLNKWKLESNEDFENRILFKKQYIEYDGNLYKLSNIYNEIAHYSIVSKLGVKNKVLEYDLNDDKYLTDSEYNRNYKKQIEENLLTKNINSGVSAFANRFSYIENNPYNAFSSIVEERKSKYIQELKEAGRIDDIKMVESQKIENEDQLDELINKLCKK